MRKYSFGKAISTGREFPAGVEQDRQGDINNRYDRERTEPSAETPAGIMPDRRRHDAGKGHREHEFPGKIHDLINPRARKRAAHPDVNDEQDRQLEEEPNVRGHSFEESNRRMPAAEK